MNEPRLNLEHFTTTIRQGNSIGRDFRNLI